MPRRPLSLPFHSGATLPFMWRCSLSGGNLYIKITAPLSFPVPPFMFKGLKGSRQYCLKGVMSVPERVFFSFLPVYRCRKIHVYHIKGGNVLPDSSVRRWSLIGAECLWNMVHIKPDCSVCHCGHSSRYPSNNSFSSVLPPLFFSAEQAPSPTSSTLWEGVLHHSILPPSNFYANGSHLSPSILSAIHVDGSKWFSSYNYVFLECVVSPSCKLMMTFSSLIEPFLPLPAVALWQCITHTSLTWFYGCSVRQTETITADLFGVAAPALILFFFLFSFSFSSSLQEGKKDKRGKGVSRRPFLPPRTSSPSFSTSPTLTSIRSPLRWDQDASFLLHA